MKDLQEAAMGESHVKNILWGTEETYNHMSAGWSWRLSGSDFFFKKNEVFKFPFG